MTESPFRQNPKERRAMLSAHFVQAITPLLERTSYADLGVVEVIKAGGIARTTFYAYFDDKTDLLLAMSATIVDDLHEVAFWRLPDDADKEDLREALRVLVRTYRGHRLLLRALVEGAGYDARLREVYEAVVQRGVDNVTRHIEEGQTNGSIAPFLSPGGTARLLVYMGERSLYRTIGVEGQEDESAFLDPLTEVFWRTLYDGYR